MPEKIIIYGIECTIPDAPDNIPIEANKFVRVKLPESFKYLDYDKEDRPIYNDEQLTFIDREITRCTVGFWFWNKGVLTYITGHHYRYLTYWVLENGQRPEYRDAGRRHFVFFETVYNHPKIIGELRGKKRREGATSEGTCISVGIATFNANTNCGTMSMNDVYAEKVFQTMIRYGFFNQPEFLRPRLDRSGTNKKDLNFVETPERGKGKSATIEGLNSRIDFQPLTLNTYDSTRLSFLLGDEWGKIEKIDINRLFEVVKECVKQGVRKVGFIYAPTTCNPPDKGGDNFKILWDNSNQFEYGLDTPTGMVQYFQPAWEGMEGFIDEYGFSVVEPPDDETLQYLINQQLLIPDLKSRIPTEDLVKGAKKYLEDEFSKLKTAEQKSDFRRKFPFTSDDMFDFGATYSPFNISNIRNRELYLANNPSPLRQGDLVLETTQFVGQMGDMITDYKVQFRDNKSGSWLIYELPKNPNNFEIDWDKKICRPLNTLEYCGGVDTFRMDSTEALGSKGVIFIGSKLDVSKPDGLNGGIPCAYYIGRPNLTEFFWKEVLLATMYWGCIASVESDATQEIRKYFNNTMKNEIDLNCLPLLGRRPDAAIDPNRVTKLKNIYSIPSADPFVFSKQIELCQIYVEKYIHKIYFPELLDDMKKFNPDKRTKRDLTMGFMMMLLSMTGQSKARMNDYKGEKLIQEYILKSDLRY